MLIFPRVAVCILDNSQDDLFMSMIRFFTVRPVHVRDMLLVNYITNNHVTCSVPDL